MKISETPFYCVEEAEKALKRNNEFLTFENQPT